MYNTMSGSDFNPGEAKELIRASYVRIGKLPDLKKGTVVHVDYCGRWSKARIERKIPGGYYMATLITYPGNGTLITVTIGVFGGVAANA